MGRVISVDVKGDNTMRRLIAVLTVCFVFGACDLVTPASPTEVTINQTTTVNAGGGTTPGNPDPTNPNPTTPPRPLPAGAQATAAAAAAANAHLIGTSCQATDGVAAWYYMDAIVDALRATDRNWGYACRPGNCADPSGDTIAYYAGSGTPVTGIQGVHRVDIILGHCGASPAPSWQVIPYDATGAWTSRGRF